jgi:hypothetical protein
MSQSPEVDINKALVPQLQDYLDSLCDQRAAGDKHADTVLSKKSLLAHTLQKHFEEAFNEVFYVAGYYANFVIEPVSDQMRLSLTMKATTTTNPVGRLFKSTPDPESIPIGILSERKEGEKTYFTGLLPYTGCIVSSKPMKKLVSCIHERYLDTIAPALTSVLGSMVYLQTFSPEQQAQFQSCVRVLFRSGVPEKMGRPMTTLNSLLSERWENGLKEAVASMRRVADGV